jgi:sigma-B regulation protein RsbU (phosphoserine phosphatase)
MFVTAWFGILDRTTGKITAVSAGHEFPLLRGSTGNFELLKDRHGFVLGGMDMTRYREYEIDLPPGGTLYVYTDGAAEATNSQDELFGTDRMLDALNQNPELHPEGLCKAMVAAIDEFVGEAPQFDDLTMLCIRYNGWEA